MKQLVLGIPFRGDVYNVAFNLRVTFGAEGSAKMDGAILVVSALDATAPVQEQGSPVRLVANGAPAEASCADADGDGHAGLVGVAADFENARTGDRVPVALEMAAGHDVDRTGIYPLQVRIGDDEMQVKARAILQPARRRSRRRGRRR